MEMVKNVWSRCLLSVWILVSLTVPSVSEDISRSYTTPNFAIGQEWTVKTPSLSTAKIIIGRIEPFQNKTVIHITIIDIPNLVGGGSNKLTQIDHIPFDESALAESVGNLIAVGVTIPPDFDAGYRQWKKDRGGVFTVSVAQAIDLGLKMLNRHD